MRHGDLGVVHGIGGSAGASILLVGTIPAARNVVVPTEAGREWKGGRARTSAQETLTREGLSGDEAGAQSDQLPRDSLRDSKASSASARERGDEDVGSAPSKGREGAIQIGIAEKQRTGRGSPFPRRERLAFPSAPEADDYRARFLGALGSPVRRVPVDDDDRGLREVPP